MNEIEALARKNLGMVKEGEQFMFIIDDKPTDPPSDSDVKRQSNQHEQ
jgi:hypothetical protein